jgi:hypothetical protein
MIMGESKMDKKPLIGIVIYIILIVNVSVVLGNTGENPHENVAGMEPNLAPNPSFEEGDTIPTGWTYSSDTNGIYTWDSAYAYSGEKSIGVLNLTGDIYPPYMMWITTDFIPVNCTKNSYMFSAWFKFVEIPPKGQGAKIRILCYDINYQLDGSGSSGYGSTDTDWHYISHGTGYSPSIKFVKLEIGQYYNLEYEPDPLVEIRFDDVNFTLCNTAPNTPTITGETNGRIRTLYDYTITTIDPNQDNVTYEIEWGDNTTQTTGSYESGEEIIISHIWGIKGTYNIRVRAMDEHYGAKSDWATLTVTMPYSYNLPIQRLLQSFLERFPNAFPILRQLVGY